MKQQFVCHTCCIINKRLFVDKKPKDPKTGVTFEIYAYRRLPPQEMHDVISTYLSQKKPPKRAQTAKILTIIGA
jgi:hypothetical protein